MEELAEWECSTPHPTPQDTNEAANIEANGLTKIESVSEVAVEQTPTWILDEILQDACRSDVTVEDRSDRIEIVKHFNDCTVYEVNPTTTNSDKTYIVPDLFGGLMNNWNFDSAAHIIDEELPTIQANDSNLIYTGSIARWTNVSNETRLERILDMGGPSALEYDEEQRKLSFDDEYYHLFKKIHLASWICLVPYIFVSMLMILTISGPIEAFLAMTAAGTVGWISIAAQQTVKDRALQHFSD